MWEKLKVNQKSLDIFLGKVATIIGLGNGKRCGGSKGLGRLLGRVVAWMEEGEVGK